jgi:hypothetical protein
MSIRYFKSLLFKSAQIQREIEKEVRRSWPDWIRLLKLKKIRLAIEDRLERLVYETTPHRPHPIRVKIHRGHLKK